MQVSNDPVVAMRASMAMSAQAATTGNPDHDYAVQMSAHHWVFLNPCSPTYLHLSMICGCKTQIARAA